MRRLVLVVFLASSVVALGGEKPAARWAPVPHFNHRATRKIDMVVIHTVEGSASSAVETFRHSPRNVSAHYVVGKDGSILQCVKDEDIAWHAGPVNDHSIGIEHEGFSNRRDTWTDALYASSARLTRWICDTYGVPIDRQHIVGHSETPHSPHGDPGKYFDWDRYMKLVRGDAAPTQEVAPIPSQTLASIPADEGLPPPAAPRQGGVPTGPQQTTAPSQTPAPSQTTAPVQSATMPSAPVADHAPSTGMTQALDHSTKAPGEPAKASDASHPLLAQGARGESVRDLQHRINEDAQACVLDEDGKFGPETEKAVRAFQEKHGCKVDGIVGPETWGALEKAAKGSSDGGAAKTAAAAR